MSYDHAVYFLGGNGILLSKLFRPTMRKNCSSYQEKLLKVENLQHFLDKNDN